MPFLMLTFVCVAGLQQAGEVADCRVKMLSCSNRPPAKRGTKTPFRNLGACGLRDRAERVCRAFQLGCGRLHVGRLPGVLCNAAGLSFSAPFAPLQTHFILFIAHIIRRCTSVPHLTFGCSRNSSRSQETRLCTPASHPCSLVRPRLP